MFFFEFPAILTGSLTDIKRLLDLDIGVLTCKDGRNLAKIKTNMSVLTEEIIATMNRYLEDEVTAREARRVLTGDLRMNMNAILASVAGAGVIDKVFLTFFAIE